jgi:(p)ppGpp synthase/HD superfamily hydrolase
VPVEEGRLLDHGQQAATGGDDLLVATARAIAVAAHAGQVDKAGEPYISHPGRVAARLARPEERAAAWLHDVLEDTPTTGADLHAAGIPDAVVAAVEALTRRRDEIPADYYARVRANPVALAVKAADIADNSDPVRLARLDRDEGVRLAAKYRAARVALGLPS